MTPSAKAEGAFFNSQTLSLFPAELSSGNSGASRQPPFSTLWYNHFVDGARIGTFQMKAALILPWHRVWGWSAFLWRVATLDTREIKHLRRFARRKVGVREWWR